MGGEPYWGLIWGGDGRYRKSIRATPPGGLGKKFYPVMLLLVGGSSDDSGSPPQAGSNDRKKGLAQRIIDESGPSVITGRLGDIYAVAQDVLEKGTSLIDP